MEKADNHCLRNNYEMKEPDDRDKTTEDEYLCIMQLVIRLKSNERVQKFHGLEESKHDNFNTLISANAS